jgi:hypothetical protein
MGGQEESAVNTVQVSLMSYGELRERQKSHLLIRSEVPTEHAVSLPLPTLAWSEPGYAYFAAPAVRRPNEPMRQGAPDRWWVITARGGRLLVYALCKAQSFPTGAQFAPQTLPRISVSRDQLQQSLKAVEAALEAQAPLFFAQESGNAAERKHLLDMLGELLPQPLLPQYRALCADFFSWLER